MSGEEHERGLFEGKVLAQLDAIQATVKRIEASHEPRLVAVEEKVQQVEGGIKTLKWFIGAAVSVAGLFGYTIKH